MFTFKIFIHGPGAVALRLIALAASTEDLDLHPRTSLTAHNCAHAPSCRPTDLAITGPHPPCRGVDFPVSIIESMIQLAHELLLGHSVSAQRHFWFFQMAPGGRTLAP